MTSTFESLAAAQVPAPGALTLDHLAYFVPDIESASGALEKAGFALTPFSAQSHRAEPGGPVVPAGTGNRCAMLGRGYLEFLTPTGDTGVAHQLREAMERYVGVHSIVFGTSAPDADHARLDGAGFAPLPPVALQRQVDTTTSTEMVRFTVVRTPPGTMAEGRIQFCLHHTPELVWQERWLAHPNRAVALNAVVICAADPREAAQRYARYTGLPAQESGSVWRVETARGCLLIVAPDTLRRRLAVEPPSLPWLAGYCLESADMKETGDVLRRNGQHVHVLGNRRLLVKLPPTVGGMVVFEPGASGTLNFD